MLAQDNISSLLFAYKKQVLFVLIGLALLAAAVLVYQKPPQSSKVEIIEPQTLSSQEIVVEIAGSIIKPGVYKLPAGSRVDDLVQMAGGFTENVDKERVEKTINRASVLKDSQKFYIPSLNEQTAVLSATSEGEGLEDQTISTISAGGTININTASKQELESLWGIGPATAQKLIEQRPYSDVEELLTKSIVKKNVFERIKDLISVH